MDSVLDIIQEASASRAKLLSVLIDPDNFKELEVVRFLQNLPAETSFILIGGSFVEAGKTESCVRVIKENTNLPIVLFPGDHTQISPSADAILFLSLISGRNPEYLIDQQVKSVPVLRKSSLEIIPTGYILIEGGRESAVEKVSNTRPGPQQGVSSIVDTALAGEYLGKKLIYLEAGSGAKFPVGKEVISEVRKGINVPLIVGGGIRSRDQLTEAFDYGADVVVIGTAFEKGLWQL